jgi:amino acid transporter
VQAILGPQWGFVIGWVYAGAWLFIGSYVTLGFGGYLQRAFSAGPLTAGGLPPLPGALLLIATSVGINLPGGQLFGRVQKVLVLLVVVTLMGGGLAGLSCAVAGLHGAGLSHLSLVLPHGISGVLAMAPLAFLALAGFDMVATTGDEVKNPRRTLPLAILLLYLLVTTATAGVLSGHQQLSTTTPQQPMRS